MICGYDDSDLKKVLIFSNKTFAEAKLTQEVNYVILRKEKLILTGELASEQAERRLEFRPLYLIWIMPT